jgi:hypothetical protein
MAKRPQPPPGPDRPGGGHDPQHVADAGSGTGEQSADGGGDAPAYEVGYKKPPAEHRFRPGQSGNPKGGKRGRRKPSVHQFAEMFEKVMMEPVEARTRKGTVKKPGLVVAAQVHLQRAMAGDVRSMRLVLDVHEKATALLPDPASLEVVSEADANAIIESHLQGLLEAAKQRDSTNGDQS